MDVKGGFLLENGFRVLPVKFDRNSSAIRHLFYKEHRVHHATDDTKPEGRTLFVINVPPYCTEESIGELFKKHGDVEKVHFQQQLFAVGSTRSRTPNIATQILDPSSSDVKGFKVAYVVFAKEVHLRKVLKAEFSNPLFLSTPEKPLELGMKKWIRNYNASVMPDVASWQANIDRFMEEYDRKSQEELDLAKKTEGIPDDEGWIKVTKLSRKSVISRTAAKEKLINEKEAKKKPRKELQHFYSFQIRESKMEHIAQLRQKFEDDKRRISLMKEARKFKPY